MKQYVRYYDNILNKESCDYLIKIFDKHKKLVQDINDFGRPKFSQINLMQVPEKETKIDHRYIVSRFNICINQYMKELSINKHFPLQFPQSYAYEQLRVKRYLANSDDRFDNHVDVGDYLTSKRFLAFFVYLNDVKKGGETVFPEFGLTIKPKQGRVLVFPPMWMFVHAGKPAISNDKYIMGSYLHYL